MPRTLTIKFSTIKERSTAAHPTTNLPNSSSWLPFISAPLTLTLTIWAHWIAGSPTPYIKHVRSYMGIYTCRHLPREHKKFITLGFSALWKSIRATSSSTKGGLNIIALNHLPIVVGRHTEREWDCIRRKVSLASTLNRFQKLATCIWQPTFHTCYSN